MATELLRVEKKNARRLETMLFSLMSDGVIRRGKIVHYADGDFFCGWKNTIKTNLTSEKWLAVCREQGFEATNKVHQLV